jgi:hypothetical protein
MLQAAVLSAANALAVFSPTKNCRVRVAAPANLATTLEAAVRPWYRNDPYNWRALSSPVKAMLSPEHPKASPVKRAAAHDELPMAVPQANRLLYAHVAAAPQPTHTSPAPAVPVQAAPAKPAAPLVRYAIVRYKFESCTYVAPFKIAVGDLVVVEGDRGEDLGCVEEIITEAPSYPVPCKVLRKASRKDQEALQVKRAKEAATKRQTQALAESVGLNINIADVEFQFDYNKLTVYFDSNQHPLDFRKLQRSLFREFRCRIWLSYLAEIEHQEKLPRSR